jgi:O-antigen/teichoic acid export membrane protein
MWINVTTALANLAMSIALVTSMGIEGVALGTTIPTVIASVLLAIHVCRVTGVSFAAYFRRGILPPVLCSWIAPAVWCVAMMSWPIHNWSRFLIIGTVGTLLYAVAAVSWELGCRVLSRRTPLVRSARNSSVPQETIQVIPAMLNAGGEDHNQ